MKKAVDDFLKLTFGGMVDSVRTVSVIDPITLPVPVPVQDFMNAGNVNGSLL